MTFYDTLSGYYDQLFPPRESTVRFLEHHLPREGRVLDIGCGTGEYCLALARKGFSCVGIDLTPDMIARAREKVRGEPAEFFVGSMLELESVDGKFHGVYCIGNTLVHLEDPSEVSRMLKACRNLLTQGGVLIVQIVNYERILSRKIDRLPDIDAGPVTLLRHYEMGADGRHIVFTITLQEQGKDKNNRYEERTNLLPLTSRELATLLGNAGFTDAAFFGSYQEEPYTEESPACIVKARNP